jgi:VCBS repeat-containing protein
VFNADGSYSFNPGSDFDDLAARDSRNVTFTYTATDNDGAASSEEIMTITVTGTNDAPVAVADAVSTGENTVLNGTVPAASDVDGTAAPNGYALSATNLAEGSFVLNNDGSYSFNPGTNFDDLAAGDSRNVTFIYTATDNLIVDQ